MEQEAGQARASAYIAYVFRIMIGGMFLYAGVVHVLDPKGFAEAVANYRILPTILVNPFSIILPAIEMIAGITMILGLFIPGSSLIISGLLAMFAIALAAALFKGLDISCGCFTTSKKVQSISWNYLGRDLCLLAMALFVFYFDTGLASIARLVGLKR